MRLISTAKTIALLLVVASTASTSSSAPISAGKWPWKYDWNKFPAAWFGGNATAFESDEQLEAIGKYSLAILGWQHLITKTNWTASVYAQIEQAAIIKAKFPSMPVYIYTGFGNADFYNNETWTVAEPTMRGCSNNQPCRNFQAGRCNFGATSSASLVAKSQIGNYQISFNI